MSSHRRGAYFMSDDRILDLTIAFLNSFRKHNPEIPLRLIPYDDRTDRLRSLQTEYGFSVYDDEDVLSRCDELSVRFHGRVLGQYRKLAMWEGGFDEFVYIDCDTVVLGNVDFVFAYLDDHDVVTSHSNLRTLRQFVWKKTIYRTGLLTREQIAYSANTGFIASKRRVLPLESALDAARNAEKLTPHMVLYCAEQPFLNYLIVTSGKRYTSLRVLEKSRKDPRMMAERWAGERWGVVRNGSIRFPGRRPPVLLLHWAGKWQPTATDRRLLSLLRRLGLKDRGEEPLMRFFMPYRRLWNHYRFLRERKPS
jgi:hypothetical protein